MLRHVLAALLLMPATVLADDGPQYLERCLHNVLEKRPGRVLKLEYKVEADNKRYEFNIRGMDGKDWDVECQRNSGDIVELEQEVAHPNHPLFKRHARINEKEARAIALSIFDGEIVEVEYELEADNAASYEFDIDTPQDGQIKIEIDAASGEVVEVNHELWQIGLE